MSLRSRVESQKQRNENSKQEWDRTTTTSQRGGVKPTVEEKMASQIAREMLMENQKLRGIHSNVSIKKIIEKEAKRQLLAETGGKY